MRRSREEQERINAAMAARPKVKLIGAYGSWKAGEVISPSPAQRAYLINNGFAKAEGGSKKDEGSKKPE